MLQVHESYERLGPAESKSPLSRTFLCVSKATLGSLIVAVKKSSFDFYHSRYPVWPFGAQLDGLGQGFAERPSHL